MTGQDLPETRGQESFCPACKRPIRPDDKVWIVGQPNAAMYHIDCRPPSEQKTPISSDRVSER